MAFVEWKDEYSVRVTQMDDEHKKLFTLIGDLHEAVKDGKTNEGIARAIKGLLDYTASHFGHEEELMKKAGYKGLAAQQAAHRAFTDKVKEYDARLQAGKLVLLFDVGNFTRTWLTEHIKAMDRQYSEVLAPTAK